MQKETGWSIPARKEIVDTLTDLAIQQGVSTSAYVEWLLSEQIKRNQKKDYSDHKIQGISS